MNAVMHGPLGQQFDTLLDVMADALTTYTLAQCPEIYGGDDNYSAQMTSTERGNIQSQCEQFVRECFALGYDVLGEYGNEFEYTTNGAFACGHMFAFERNGVATGDDTERVLSDTEKFNGSHNIPSECIHLARMWPNTYVTVDQESVTVDWGK